MENIYSWTFDNRKERSSTWYMVAISIAIWLVIWWFLTKQYGMSFIIILITWVFYYIDNNSEDEITVVINELWLNIWNNFYDFSVIESYTFIYEQENAIFLRLLLLKSNVRHIDLNIDNSIAIELKNILPNFITENPKEELTFSEKMINKINL